MNIQTLNLVSNIDNCNFENPIFINYFLKASVKEGL